MKHFHKIHLCNQNYYACTTRPFCTFAYPKHQVFKMIHKDTLAFLKALTQHNHKTWFDEHRASYLKAKEDFETFVQELINEIALSEPEFALLKAKDCVFRIYRDVRFSKNKTPYKDHLAAGINKGGKRVHVPGYHLHLTIDGESFFAGGIWRPNNLMLAKIRQEIDYNFEEFQELLNKIKDSGKFALMEDEEALSRPPKGYSEDNPAIAYLKMKNFVLSSHFTNQQITDKSFLSNLMASYRAFKPFLQFIERSLD